ncbi:hypothetical protein GCM10022280_05650 [Sphingomonas swuensis]|uniref:DUF4350 domain-containing protein n=1 Tax=Sphingomonas swuensis TaxID=977800 RepID=A0ABP7SFJ5_9SPHN
MRLSLLLALALVGCRQEAPASSSGTARPELALLTSLPILFGEQFTLDQPRSPLLAALEKDYRVTAVDGPEQVAPGATLLAIQPQALTAERLVALDSWVRDGGRLVLLADPALRWESSRPLGDRFRPPYSFPDTGLLRHWGLTLRLLEAGEEGATTLRLGKGRELTGQAGIGALAATGRECTATQALARCTIGLGRVIVVGDADFAMSDDLDDLAALVSLVGEVAR